MTVATAPKAVAGLLVRTAWLTASHAPGEDALRNALAIATLHKVGEARPIGWHMVPHTRTGFIDDPTSGKKLRQPDAEVRLFPAERAAVRVSEAMKELEVLEDLTSKRHVRADQVSHGGARLGEAAVRAADHPVELGQKPCRARTRPAGGDPPAHCCDLLILIRFCQALKPIGLGQGIIVDKGNDGASRSPCAGVARPGQPGRSRAREGNRARELAGESLEQSRFMVYDHQNLVRQERLRLKRRDARRQPVPALSGVGADDDGDFATHRRPSAARRGRRA
jgi:hypothetical protein